MTVLVIQKKPLILILETCKFKAHEILLLNRFCLVTVSKDFTKNKMKEISLNGTVYDFSVDLVQLKIKIYLVFINI